MVTSFLRIYAITEDKALLAYKIVMETNLFLSSKWQSVSIKHNWCYNYLTKTLYTDSSHKTIIFLHAVAKRKNSDFSSFSLFQLHNFPVWERKSISMLSRYIIFLFWKANRYQCYRNMIIRTKTKIISNGIKPPT